MGILPYLPKVADPTKILELSLIRASVTKKGYGRKLMEQFLNSDVAKTASLIVLEPSSYIQNSLFTEMSREQIEALLHKFYRSFGFKQATGVSNLMYLKPKKP